MALNPFKESNLSDLQANILDFIHRHFDDKRKKLRLLWESFKKKGNERITIMFIPHSEKKIVNFHVTKFTISFILITLTISITITSIAIVRHTSTVKEVSKLKMYKSNSRIQIQKYREEINKLYDIFQKFKPELTYLYTLTPENNVDSLWAKGGNPHPSLPIEEDPNSPPIEILNIEEIERELKITKDVLKKVKNFLETRKKILNNTPSSWPVEGYIISRFGMRSSPLNFRNEFHPGIDIAAFPGAEIRATAPGKVSDVRWDPVYGLKVSINHKYGFMTHYSHCQRVTVDVGDKVSKGEIIGYVGKTGKASRHQCFYQVQIGTEFVDPVPYLNRISQ